MNITIIIFRFDINWETAVWIWIEAKIFDGKTNKYFKNNAVSDCGTVLVNLTCCGEGELVIVPLSGHTYIHLHLLQQGRVDL